VIQYLVHLCDWIVPVLIRGSRVSVMLAFECWLSLHLSVEHSSTRAKVFACGRQSIMGRRSDQVWSDRWREMLCWGAQDRRSRRKTSDFTVVQKVCFENTSNVCRSLLSFWEDDAIIKMDLSGEIGFHYLFRGTDRLLHMTRN
jgi:hypothetical protein